MDLDGNFVAPKHGFAVGLHGIDPDQYFSPNDPAWRARVRESGLRGAPEDYFIGFWAGEWDLVRIVTSHAEALALAQANGQRAIYNFATDTVLPVG